MNTTATTTITETTTMKKIITSVIVRFKKICAEIKATDPRDYEANIGGF